MRCVTQCNCYALRYTVHKATVTSLDPPSPKTTENQMDVIALDIGRSAVKIAAPGGVQFTIPSVVMPAVDASRLAVDGSAESAKRDLVELDGQEYFIGQTAADQVKTREPTGLFAEWIETDAHKALLKGAYERAKKESGSNDGMLILGLPSEHYHTHKDQLAKIAALTLRLPLEHVMVLPQAFGAYMALMLDEDSAAAPGREPKAESWGVIDVGFYTTDFGLLSGGKWVGFASESVDGSHKAAETLVQSAAKYGVKRGEADEVLRRGTIRHMNQVVNLEKEVAAARDSLAKEIIDAASRVFGERLPRLNGILVAGGGSDYVFKQIKKVWPHAETLPNARMAIAEGLRRYGIGTVRRANAAKA